VLDAIPDVPRRPTALAARIGLSRVTCSKLLGALDRPDPYELLEAIPGPESLRTAASAAATLGVDAGLVGDAHAAIDSFATLVRDHFGTRAALNAAIGGRSSKLRARVDQAGRADVFNGLRRVLGVEANTWLTTMFFTPSPEDEDIVAVTTLHGALGLRRLRSDTQVYFTFGAPYRDADNGHQLSLSPISLQEFYTHEPARLETKEIGGQLRHRLDQDRLGKHAVMDMLTVSHDAHGSRRYGTPEAPLRGVSLFVDVPVRMLVCDVIVHHSVFPDCAPETIVYNTSGRGPANPNDPLRDLDRVAVAERIQRVPATLDGFNVPEVPNYDAMIQHVCQKIRQPLDDFRVYRLRMAYPVQSFQFVIAFRAPLKPAS
jgi:hypothetical protein